MPEALATSKRKFYKFLDNLSGAPRSNSPSASLSNVPLSLACSQNSPAPIGEPASKRIRYGTTTTSTTELSSIHKRNVSTTSLASTASMKRKLPAAGETKARELPTFSPWSHDTFLQRLKTFASVSQWHSKPDAINEVAWAKRGWQCVDTNTVACRGGCELRVVVRMEPVAKAARRLTVQEDEGGEPRDSSGLQHTSQVEQDAEEGWTEDEAEFDEAFEESMVEKYKTLIIDGHGESCLWRQAGCKNDIYRLPIVRSAVWQGELRDRYLSLVDRANSITALRLVPSDTTPPAERLLANLPSALLTSPSINTLPGTPSEDSSAAPTQPSPVEREQSLRIALYGWRCTIEAGTALLACDACFQRIGLWMYQPEYKRPARSSSDDEGDDILLDLVEMHREHCPWRNETSQCATGDFAGLPAWQILSRTVARFADEHRRRSRDRAVLAASSVVDVGVGNEDAASVAAIEHADTNSVAAGQSQLPELTRAEIDRLDKERVTKLRKLKRVFGLTRNSSIAK